MHYGCMIMNIEHLLYMYIYICYVRVALGVEQHNIICIEVLLVYLYLWTMCPSDTLQTINMISEWLVQWLIWYRE